jgi:hypothetical protein
MAYKYIANQPLDCILAGIPMTFRQGDLIPQQHVAHMIKNHKHAILECDENGIVLSAKPPVVAPTPVAPVITTVVDPVVVVDKEPPDPVEISEAPVKDVNLSDLPYKTQADLWTLYKHDLAELCTSLKLDPTGSKGALVARLNSVLQLPEK